MMESNAQNFSDSRLTGQQQQRTLPQEYKFSPEELKVLRECNIESFFQRSLPFGTLLGLSTYYGVKAGYLKPHNKWGPTPKVLVAITVGYFLGKLSYQTVCAEKFMKLPNSQLGKLLLQRKRGVLQENIEPDLGASMALAPFSSMPSNEVYSDFQSSSLDLDSTSLPELSHSDRPSLDSDINVSESIPPSSSTGFKTYEDLRQQNRAEFQKNRGVNYKGPTEPSISNAPKTPNLDSDLPFMNTPSVTGRRNKYGDLID